MDVLVAFTVFSFIYTFAMIPTTSISASHTNQISFATTSPVWAFSHDNWRRDQVRPRPSRHRSSMAPLDHPDRPCHLNFEAKGTE